VHRRLCGAVEGLHGNDKTHAFFADEFSLGIRQLSKTSSVVIDARMPILFSFLPKVKPGVPFSTTKRRGATRPLCPVGDRYDRIDVGYAAVRYPLAWLRSAHIHFHRAWQLSGCRLHRSSICLGETESNELSASLLYREGTSSSVRRAEENKMDMFRVHC